MGGKLFNRSTIKIEMEKKYEKLLSLFDKEMEIIQVIIIIFLYP